MEFEPPELTIETVQIDPEFQAICRPQTEDERKLFRNSILKEGFRDALIAWLDPEKNEWLILDGMNRWELWDHIFRGEEDRTPEAKPIELADRAAARLWVARNQLGRRNLTKPERIELAKILEPEIQEKAKRKQGERTDLSSNLTESSEPIDTREEVARAAGVSVGTVHSYDKVMNSDEEDLKQAVKSGEKSIGGAAKEVKDRQKKQQAQAPFRNAAMTPAGSDEFQRWSNLEKDLRQRMAAGNAVAVDESACPLLAEWCRKNNKSSQFNPGRFRGKAILYSPPEKDHVEAFVAAVNKR